MPTLLEINRKLKKLISNIDQISEKKVNQYSNELILLYKNALSEVKQIASEKFAKYGADSIPYQQQVALQNEIQKVLKSLGQKNIKSNTENIKDIFTLNFDKFGSAFNDSLNANISATINKEAVNAAINNKYDLISWQDKTLSQINILNDSIRNEIASGIIVGKKYETIASKISEKFNISFNKANRIIRTETHRAISEARTLQQEESKEAAERLGLTPARVWNCSFVENSRPEHEDLSGVYEDENGQWIFSDGVITDGPSLSGEAYHDTNCLCYITMEFAEL